MEQMIDLDTRHVLPRAEGVFHILFQHPHRGHAGTGVRPSGTSALPHTVRKPTQQTSPHRSLWHDFRTPSHWLTAIDVAWSVTRQNLQASQGCVGSINARNIRRSCATTWRSRSPHRHSFFNRQRPHWRGDEQLSSSWTPGCWLTHCPWRLS